MPGNLWTPSDTYQPCGPLCFHCTYGLPNEELLANLEEKVYLIGFRFHLLGWCVQPLAPFFPKEMLILAIINILGINKELFYGAIYHITKFKTSDIKILFGYYKYSKVLINAMQETLLLILKKIRF